jgi:hypothetical protein
MGLSASLYPGTGKATCKLCRKIIKKGELQITMYGYQTQGSVHAERKDCKEDLHGLQTSSR